MKRGGMRYSEEQYRDLAARGARFQRGAEVVNTESMPDAHADIPGDGSRPARASGTSKYRAVKTDGYASKKEARRAAELRVLEQMGKIRNLREQVPYLLIPAAKDAHGKCIERACSYIADFCFEEAPAWHPVVLDVKGVRTDAYIIKRKLMYMVHGLRVREE